MKKRAAIKYSAILLSIILIIAITALSINTIISHIVCTQLDRVISQADTLDIRYGSVRTDVLTGHVWINDIYLQTDTLSEADSLRNMARLEIDQVSIDGIRYRHWWKTKNLVLRGITIKKPIITTWAEQNKQKKSPKSNSTEQTPKDTLAQQKIHEYLKDISVERFSIHDGNAYFGSRTNALRANAKGLNLEIHDIGYSLIDSTGLHYNDSLYSISLAHLRLITPDKLMEVTANDFAYSNGGAIQLGETRVHHIVDKWALGPLKGNTPQKWIDVCISSIRTSPKNLVREATSLKEGFSLDSLNVKIASFTLFKDKRFPIQKPFGTPQDAILKIKYPLCIKHVNIEVERLSINAAPSREQMGTLIFGPLRANISNITFREGQTIHAKASGKMGHGDVRLNFDLLLNKSSEWRAQVEGTNLDMHHLDNFMSPFAGMKIGCDVSHIVADYQGDGKNANGTFCMEYTNLDVHAYHNSPIKIVADMSDFINSFAKTCLPPRNPMIAGDEPKAYYVKWKNDPWKEPAMFYIGPLINGTIETMFPGIFVQRKIKNNDNLKQVKK